MFDRETGQILGMVSVHELLTGRKRAVARESERLREFSTASSRIVADSTGSASDVPLDHTAYVSGKVFLSAG